MNSLENARKDYIMSGAKLSELSRKYNIKYATLRYRAKKEDWEGQREASKSDILKREEKILILSDKLLEKIERSINEIDRCIIKTKEKIKSVEYDADLKKPVNESVEERENIQIIDGMVDKMGLKQLVSTLKDIKDIHMSFTGEESVSETEGGIILLGDIDEATMEERDEIFSEVAI